MPRTQLNASRRQGPQYQFVFAYEGSGSGTAIWTREFEMQALRDILAEDCWLKLAVNNLVPSRSTALADLVEASGSGYAAQTIKGFASGTPEWVVTGADPQSYATGPKRLFVFSAAAGDFYLFYLVGKTSGKLKTMPQRLSTVPMRITGAGQPISVKPILTAQGLV